MQKTANVPAAVMVLGFEGLHYRTSLNLGTETVFILLYVMIAYYRWYMKPLSAWVGAVLGRPRRLWCW